MNESLEIKNFFNEDYLTYAGYDNFRKISSVIDGLKPSSRKVVYTLDKFYKCNQVEKVSLLMSNVSRKTEYLHGESSLYGVIVGMAQDFVDTNNIPLLTKNGSFGTRLLTNAAASRYIFTSKTSIFESIFLKDDYPLLECQNFEGNPIEPKQYYPIIPLILVNGSLGLSTGFMGRILSRNPVELIDAIETKLKGKSIDNFKFIPYFHGFSGDISRNENSWQLSGKIKKVNDKLLQIDELPVGFDLPKYIKVLDDLYQAKIIKDYHDLSTDNSFIFKIKVDSDFFKAYKSRDEIMRLFKLTKSISEVFVCMDENNVIKEFEDVFEIFNHFYNFRFRKYESRRTFILKALKEKLVYTFSKLTFLRAIIDGNLKIEKRKREDIEKDLSAYEKIVKVDDSYDYLFRIPIFSLTLEQLKKLVQEIKDLTDEYKIFKEKTVEDLWLQDLKNLRKELKTIGIC